MSLPTGHTVTPDEATEWLTGRPDFDSLSVYDLAQTVADEPRRVAAATTELQAEVDRLRSEVTHLQTMPRDLALRGTWLIEYTGRHTCGTGPNGHYGQHEPGCGEEPLVDLSTLPGFALDAADPGTIVTHAEAWRVVEQFASITDPSNRERLIQRLAMTVATEQGRHATATREAEARAWDAAHDAASTGVQRYHNPHRPHRNLGACPSWCTSNGVPS